MFTKITRFFLELIGWLAAGAVLYQLPTTATHLTLTELQSLVVLALGMMWVSRLAGWRISIVEL